MYEDTTDRCEFQTLHSCKAYTCDYLQAITGTLIQNISNFKVLKDFTEKDINIFKAQQVLQKSDCYIPLSKC